MTKIIGATIQKIDNRKDPSRPYSLAWQNGLMPAPAFEYYPTEAAARVAAAALIMQERPEPDPPPRCGEVLDYGPNTTRCKLPARHDGAHSDGPRRWT